MSRHEFINKSLVSEIRECLNICVYIEDEVLMNKVNKLILHIINNIALKYVDLGCSEYCLIDKGVFTKEATQEIISQVPMTMEIIDIFLNTISKGLQDNLIKEVNLFWGKIEKRGNDVYLMFKVHEVKKEGLRVQSKLVKD